MDLSHRLAISYYKTIAIINEEHKIYLVQHQETNQICIKKILDIYNINVYEHLRSNHITGTPKIIDYAEDDNQLILIEEYISGISLSDKISNAVLTLRDILNYMVDLCRVLSDLHSFDPAIIHRDIKPSNVIITHYNRAVLLDFNAAKFHSTNSTEDTVLLGTQGYAAPEQYGFGSSSPQTDIYSLGIMLKEMLASISYTSKELDAIIYKCTQMNPTERYSTINELQNEIFSLIDDKTIHTVTRSKSTYALPGFRTKTPWKMIVASASYLFISYLCLTLTVENTYGGALWLERIFCLIMMLTIVFGCFDYRNIQKLMPLCQHQNRLVRYVGIALLDFLLVFILLTVMIICESIFFK